MPLAVSGLEVLRDPRSYAFLAKVVPCVIAEGLHEGFELARYRALIRKAEGEHIFRFAAERWFDEVLLPVPMAAALSAPASATATSASATSPGGQHSLEVRFVFS